VIETGSKTARKWHLVIVGDGRSCHMPADGLGLAVAAAHRVVCSRVENFPEGQGPYNLFSPNITEADKCQQKRK
jgi:hypothetical protein